MSDYKVKLIKKYEFTLNGISKKDIAEKVSYIQNKSKILDLPIVKKITILKIKKLRRRKYK